MKRGKSRFREDVEATLAYMGLIVLTIAFAWVLVKLSEILTA